MDKPRSYFPKKTCDQCHEEQFPNNFLKGHTTCRKCENVPRMASVEDQAERHRQEKMLKLEIKKLAKKQSNAKEARKRKKSIAKLVVSSESDLEVDPATKELAQRILARRKLIEFVKRFHPRYKDGWVHHDICKRLEQFSKDVEAGLSPRLMILMPPRHGKSQIASKLYPAWHLGHYPHHEFIACSYNISLALDFSREVRDVIDSTDYNQLFPRTRLDPERKAAEAWKLQSATGGGHVGSGGYNAAGVDGGITGKGAHILVIDDPFKNAEEADNLTHREKVWNWYLSSAYSRLAPGGGILVIQTWWHDDDLSGRLQQMMKENADDEYVDKFVVVKYPAIAEEDEEFRAKGEALHPERYDLNQLLRIQRQYGGPSSRFWSALYQQNPVPTEGAMFTKAMFKYRDPTPVDGMNIIQTWDLAISEKKTNDWSVGTTLAQGFDDQLHVLEQVRLRTNNAGEIVEAMIDMYERWLPKGIPAFGVEDGQIWRTMKPLLAKRMVERMIYIPLDTDDMKLVPISDKQVRARPLQGRMQLQRVTFPRGEEWVDVLIKELLRFPGGTHDDCVDSLAWAAIVATRKSPPTVSIPRTKTRDRTVEQQISAAFRGQNGEKSWLSA